MKYCKRCLYPENHPYGIIFNEKGICSGCIVHEEKDTLNWGERLKILEKIVDINSNKVKGLSFDCIVPVTGGGDSYFIVHFVKNKLGLNPLLVNYNSHYNTKTGLRNLANLTTVFDCELLTSTLSPELLKKITKQTLKQFGNIYWQVLAGTLTFPVQVAVKLRIPLIIWGVHPWSDQTGMFSHIDQVEMSERCRKEHPLMGFSAENLISKDASISRSDVQPFIYPYDNEIESIGVRGIYLSNYIRWDSKKQHEKMIALYGYESRLQQRTFNTYEDVHCFHSAGLHDYLKFLKLGYSKVTDHASREIRLKRMTREEGVEMVKKYSTIVPTDINLFAKWIDISEDELLKIIWNRRDPKIWTKNDESWELNDSITNHVNDPGVDEARLEKNENCDFIITPSAEPNSPEDQYLLNGRVYMDERNYGAVKGSVKGGGLTNREWQEEDLKGFGKDFI